MIDGEMYIFLSTFRDLEGNGGYTTDSELVKWNSNTELFENYQTIETHGAMMACNFEISDLKFMGIALRGKSDMPGLTNQVSGIYTSANVVVYSRIYLWNEDKFEYYQEITSLGSKGDIREFVINGEHYIAAASYQYIECFGACACTYCTGNSTIETTL